MLANNEVYKRDGYIVLRDFFTPLESDAIVESANNLFKLPDVMLLNIKKHQLRPLTPSASGVVCRGRRRRHPPNTQWLKFKYFYARRVPKFQK